MGPYYRHTSQGMGNFFEILYEHPVLMSLAVAGTVIAGIYVWRRIKSDEASRS